MKNLRLMEGEPDCRVHLLVFPSMRLFLKLPESWRQILSRSLELDVLAALFVFAAASFTFLKLAWRPPGASAEAATHEALPADSRVDPRAPRRIHARVSRRPLANGRSRWMVHWNGLGAGMLAYCDLATKWRYH